MTFSLLPSFRLLFRTQLTAEVPLQLQPDGAVFSVPAEIVALSSTPVAVTPLFEIATVYVTSPPISTGSGVSVIESIDKSVLAAFEAVIDTVELSITVVSHGYLYP